jgi:hypothetical protein
MRERESERVREWEREWESERKEKRREEKRRDEREKREEQYTKAPASQTWGGHVRQQSAVAAQQEGLKVRHRCRNHIRALWHLSPRRQGKVRRLLPSR